jgi:hypothetical protein
MSGLIWERSIASYIQRFRDIRSRCFSLSLPDQQLLELVFQEMVAPIKVKFTSQAFDNMAQHIEKALLLES